MTEALRCKRQIHFHPQQNAGRAHDAIRRLPKPKNGVSKNRQSRSRSQRRTCRFHRQNRERSPVFTALSFGRNRWNGQQPVDTVPDAFVKRAALKRIYRTRLVPSWHQLLSVDPGKMKRELRLLSSNSDMHARSCRGFGGSDMGWSQLAPVNNDFQSPPYCNRMVDEFLPHGLDQSFIERP